MLHPAPVGRLLTRKARARREAAQLVVVVVLFGVPVLVPHGIGHHPVKNAEFAPVAEFGAAESVADFYPALHVVDDHVHIGHRPGVGNVFLTVELERRSSSLAVVLGLHGQLALDQEASRAAARVVNRHAQLRVHDLGHDHPDFSRRVELAGGLARRPSANLRIRYS